MDSACQAACWLLLDGVIQTEDCSSNAVTTSFFLCFCDSSWLVSVTLRKPVLLCVRDLYLLVCINSEGNQAVVVARILVQHSSAAMLVRNALQCLKGSAVWTTSASVAVRSLTPPAQQHYPLPSLQQYQQPLVASEVTRGLTSTASWVPSPVTGWLKRRQRRLLKQQGIKPAARLIAGAVSPHRPVPAHIHRPDYAAAVATTGSRSSSTGPGLSKRPEIQADASSQAGMRAAGKLAAEALQLAGSMAVPGVTTDAIDAAVHEFIISRGAYPSPLGYHGFPKSICTSVNEVVCHGEHQKRVPLLPVSKMMMVVFYGHTTRHNTLWHEEMQEPPFPLPLGFPTQRDDVGILPKGPLLLTGMCWLNQPNCRFVVL